MILVRVTFEMTEASPTVPIETVIRFNLVLNVAISWVYQNSIGHPRVVLSSLRKAGVTTVRSIGATLKALHRDLALLQGV
jgi:hypothetical protein